MTGQHRLAVRAAPDPATRDADCGVALTAPQRPGYLRRFRTDRCRNGIHPGCPFLACAGRPGAGVLRDRVSVGCIPQRLPHASRPSDNVGLCLSGETRVQDQPRTAAAPSGATVSYTYDPAGNKLTSTAPTASPPRGLTPPPAWWRRSAILASPHTLSQTPMTPTGSRPLRRADIRTERRRADRRLRLRLRRRRRHHRDHLPAGIGRDLGDLGDHGHRQLRLQHAGRCTRRRPMRSLCRGDDGVA
jgi:YD repeat-containing protein